MLLCPLLIRISAVQKRSSEALRTPRYLSAQERGASIPDEPPAGEPPRDYSWGTQLKPWEIAWNGQRWLEEHLSMADVRESFRCVSRFSAGSWQAPGSFSAGS